MSISKKEKEKGTMTVKTYKRKMRNHNNERGGRKEAKTRENRQEHIKRRTKRKATITVKRQKVRKSQHLPCMRCARPGCEDRRDEVWVSRSPHISNSSRRCS